MGVVIQFPKRGKFAEQEKKRQETQKRRFDRWFLRSHVKQNDGFYIKPDPSQQ